MIERLRDVGTPWTGQVELVREWYQPQLERLYDYAAARTGDLDQLEQIAAGYVTRERFLTELTLEQIPQLGGIVFGEIGAQEIAPLAPARPSQPIAVEVVGKGDALRRYRDDDQAPRGWGMGSGTAIPRG